VFVDTARQANTEAATRISDAGVDDYNADKVVLSTADTTQATSLVLSPKATNGDQEAPANKTFGCSEMCTERVAPFKMLKP